MLGQKADVSALTALDEAQLADIPDPLKAASGNTFQPRKILIGVDLKQHAMTMLYDLRIHGHVVRWRRGRGFLVHGC